MALSSQFLDQLRDRTSLSGLIGASVKLAKAGKEHKGCCPFHHEKSASFFVNDEKGFYHCFGCGAHGDAIRWMTDQRGLDFIDAVKELAAKAGMDVPAPSAEQAARQQHVETVGGVLERAAAWFGKQLAGDARATAMLAERGVGAEQVAKFGLGLAPRSSSVIGCGAPAPALVEAGLMFTTDDGYRERFQQRLMIPIHDARGRMIGFGGRALSDRQDAKYVNSPEGPHFDKGRTLYNLHRAAAPSRSARRLVVVEGYFDCVALDAAGLGEVVAPMGTAMTEAQLMRAWRVHHCPILLFDGDSAGRKAALRACERAMPMVGAQGCSLAVAVLPEGADPDSFVRAEGPDALEAVLADAVPLATFLFDYVMAEAA